MTYTYAILEVSQATYDEIRLRLIAADYAHAIDGTVIDMHGIALQVQSRDPADLEMDL